MSEAKGGHHHFCLASFNKLEHLQRHLHHYRTFILGSHWSVGRARGDATAHYPPRGSTCTVHLSGFQFTHKGALFNSISPCCPVVTFKGTPWILAAWKGGSPEATSFCLGFLALGGCSKGYLSPVCLNFSS